jgi:hypothetical protein
MKYAITGHTSGIGKAVFESCKDAIGFSKSQGYNILLAQDRKKIIEQTQDCDVFINNAHDGFGQTYMLLDLFHSWKNTNKTIINVGSKIAEDTTVLKNYEHLLEYQIQKKSLRILHNDLVNLKTNLKLKYVYFGYVGTERILKKYSNMSKDQYITVDEAVNIILHKYT